MSADEERVRLLIARQAADWFVANRTASSHAEQSAFTTWLQASPLHIEEYLAVAATARDFRAACAESVEPLDDLVARARREPDDPIEGFWPDTMRDRRASDPPRDWWGKLLPGVAVASFLAAVALATLWTLKPSPGTSDRQQTQALPLLHFATAHGEQQTHTLPDRSVLHLNTDSAVDIRFSAGERLVTLSTGEAFFEVAHEPHRAFRVLAGPARVSAIGTRFNVRLIDHVTLITVLQGTVAVASTSSVSSALPLHVEAGQEILVAGDEEPGKPQPADASRTAAWLHRQIVFEHEPLQRVASEFNRYASRRIEIVTPTLQDLEISGVFATDDTDAFIAFLRSLDGVSVEVTPGRIRVLQR